MHECSEAPVKMSSSERTKIYSPGIIQEVISIFRCRVTTEQHEERIQN